MVLRSIPPVPVAALCNQDFLESQLSLSFARLRRMDGIKFARMMEVIPGAVVLGSANPDIEVRVDPRARNQRGQRRDIAMAGNRLRNRNRFQTCLVLQRIIEAPQKFPP